jgi:hypothetical protein
VNNFSVLAFNSGVTLADITAVLFISYFLSCMTIVVHCKTEVKGVFSAGNPTKNSRSNSQQYTSIICSGCKTIIDNLNLPVRRIYCDCGLLMDQDANAGIFL